MTNSATGGMRIDKFMFIQNGVPTTLDLYKAEAESLRAKIREMTLAPIVIGCLLEIENGRALISFGGGNMTERELGPWAKGATPGMGVRCVANGLVPIAIEPYPPGKGGIVVVTKVHEKTLEFTCMAGTMVVARGAAGDVKVGDRCVLDPSEQCVVRNLGAGGTAKVFSGETKVTWDDIGGMLEAKRQMREAIEEPILKREVYERFGKRPPKGIALFGAPGCGKTLLCKAAATALAELHGASARETGFISVNGPELLHGLVGKSESNIRDLFTSARAHFDEHHYPAIIFLDEADGILGRRGSTRWEGMERTIVPQFLAEMDGLEESGALVIFATNRPESIDPAFMRKGRIDVKIEVTRPSKEDCADIFAKALRGKPLSETPQVLGRQAAEYLFSPAHVLKMSKTPTGERERITLSSIVSGALVVGIVDDATQFAIRRAVSGEENATIVTADLEEAIRVTRDQERSLLPPENG